ncbi:DUF2663 family protein [Ornithinibacillus salinisoli]|uniref:DUF2663 family protein n=1 Tax=Ornithinibacillus salinisoli TaxID=1848459 RepID=A0ABW4VZU8_9BACI
MSWEDHVTNDTRNRIDKVRKKKEYLDKWKRRESNYLLLFGVTLVLFIYYILYMTEITEQNIFYAMVDIITNLAYVLIISVISLFYYFYLEARNKVKKEKEKYKEMRGEIIKHFQKDWYVNEHSSIRDEITEMMEDEYDIDLRLKSD